MKSKSASKLAAALTAGLLLVSGCGGSDEPAPPSSKGGRGGGPPGMGGGQAGDRAPAAVPVEVAAVERDSVSSFLETNGSLEAENDVMIVSRIQGPVVELVAEEGMRLRKGDLMLEIDPTEALARVEIAKVALNEAVRAHERAKAARESEIISQEVYDTALAQLESAEAQLVNAEIEYGYTKITAPFDGIVVERLVKLAETVTANQALFRFSEFDPLLVKIQVPEKELSRLAKGQTAYLNVEAWPDERFEASVLRVSPVVEAATGTIRVTLEVSARGKLAPGMFARVFLVTDTRENAVVMPKRALSIESLSDTVFVVGEGGQAVRRNVELGYEQTDIVEVISGLEVGERVIVVGQDGLTDGTPVQVLKGPGAEDAPPSRAAQSQATTSGDGAGNGASPGPPGGRVDLSKATPEQLERIKERMRSRGMSDEQIERALARRRQQP
jgi:membrane fusion protein (multidrug efflux system)